jgi:hypothetical protein
MTIQTIDVPQADSLDTVRRVVAAVERLRSTSAKLLAADTGYSERHIRYRLATARTLGLVGRDADGSVTRRGGRLLKCDPGGPNERRELRRAIKECAAVQAVAPGLLDMATVDVGSLAARISAVTGLSPATATRRAVVLRAWHRDLNRVP